MHASAGRSVTSVTADTLQSPRWATLAAAFERGLSMDAVEGLSVRDFVSQVRREHRLVVNASGPGASVTARAAPGGLRNGDRRGVDSSERVAWDHGCRVPLGRRRDVRRRAPCSSRLSCPCAPGRCSAPSAASMTRSMDGCTRRAYRACARTGGWCCSTVMLRLPRRIWPIGAIGCSSVTSLQARCGMRWRRS